MLHPLIRMTVVTALAATLVAGTPAQASEAPAITGITTANESGGLTPYVPLFTTVVVTFTDATPSEETRYRVRVPGAEPAEHPVRATHRTGEFAAHVPASAFEDGTTYEFTVEEQGGGGTVVSTSAPDTFTFAYVDHPRRFFTSSEKVRGQWSYVAGEKARFGFRGRWEPGTRFTTQVWVSRTKKFTPRDWTYNSRRKGALVDKSNASAPVLSVRIPRALVGRYVWVSVLGWKEGEAGWLYTMPAERIVGR